MKLMVSVLIAIVLIGKLQRSFFKRMLLKSVEVLIRFDAPAVYEGYHIRMDQRVINRKGLPIRDVKLILAVGKGLRFESQASESDLNYISEVFSLNRYESAERVTELFCMKRGIYRIEKCYLGSADFYYRDFYQVSKEQKAQLAVFPKRIHEAELEEMIQNVTGEIVSRFSLYTDPFLFQGVREYQSFDPFNRINWKATARTGAMKVNKPVYASERQVHIVLDIESDRLVSDDCLIEEAIRIGARCAEILVSQDISVALIINEKTEDGKYVRLLSGASERHLQTIRYALAGANISRQAEDISEILEELSGRAESGMSDFSVLLISSQSNEKLTDAWRALCESRENSFWIKPTRLSEKPDDRRAEKNQAVWSIS